VRRSTPSRRHRLRFPLSLGFLILGLGGFALAPGCGIHDPARVGRIARQAETDPRKVSQLVNALKSDDEATWVEAYRALVTLGPSASPPIKKAIRKGHPAAQRALLVLGEMGEPSLFPFLAEARDYAPYREMAGEAFLLADEVLARRVEEERNLSLCESYLAWFPQGGSRRRVTEIQHEVTAEQAWEALGARPPDGRIQAFLDRFGDTPTGALARRALGGRRLSEAGIELVRGHHDEALRLVGEARRIDPDLDADGMESSVRFAIGKKALAEGRHDDAVRELERALALRAGEDLASVLARACYERARAAFEAGRYVLATEDLDRALQFGPALRAMVADTRMSQINQLFLMIPPAGGEVPPEVVEALVLSGQFARPTLEGVLWRYLAMGDGSMLGRIVDAAATRDETRRDPDLVPWIAGVTTRALTEADGELKLFLANRARLRTLSLPGDFLDPTFKSAARESLVVLRRYTTVLEAARYHEHRLGPLRGPHKDQAPLSAAEVAALLLAGESGFSNEALPALYRAQLLQAQIERIPRMEAALVERPAALAASILALGVSPFTLAEWTRVVLRLGEQDETRGLRIALADGTPATLQVLRSPTGWRFDLQVSGAPARIPSGWVVGSLNLLFGLARPILALQPELARVEVRVVDTASGDAYLERLSLGLGSASARRMDWRLIEAERPFTPAHLALVPDQRLR
jgi:tetratricopeptide (TPR) repeat protein